MISEATKKYKREWQARWRKEHPTEQRINAKKYQRAKMKKLGKKEFNKYHTGLIKEWRNRNPEKVKAHRVVYGALRNGSLVKQPCHCGETKVNAHHNDYSKPLEIAWLCKIHHVLADKARRKLSTC